MWNERCRHYTTRAPTQKQPPVHPGSGTQVLCPRHWPTLTQAEAQATIGAGVLNFRVRKGNGCDHPAQSTWGKTLAHSPFHTRRSPCHPRRGGRAAVWYCHTLRAKKDEYAVGSIRTGRLHPLRGFHLPPINVVISDGSQNGDLGAGFPLRCFQRLSHPDAATRRCPWRDNRYTGGSFIPVLSSCSLAFLRA